MSTCATSDFRGVYFSQIWTTQPGRRLASLSVPFLLAYRLVFFSCPFPLSNFQFEIVFKQERGELIRFPILTADLPGGAQGPFYGQPDEDFPPVTQPFFGEQVAAGSAGSFMKPIHRFRFECLATEAFVSLKYPNGNFLPPCDLYLGILSSNRPCISDSFERIAIA
jgi:hypothetical protein